MSYTTGKQPTVKNNDNKTSIEGNSIPFAYKQEITLFWFGQDQHGSDTNL